MPSETLGELDRWRRVATQAGSVRRLGPALQVRVTAGKDPVTGDRIVLAETIRVGKPGNERSERAAAAEAEWARSRLLAEADDLKAAPRRDRRRADPQAQFLLQSRHFPHFRPLSTRSRTSRARTKAV